MPPQSRPETNGITTNLNRNLGGLYGQVIDILGRKIISGEFTEGQIIQVDKICTDLQISRSVVREGIRTLSSMGLVESRPQVGTKVLPQSRWDLLQPNVIKWRGESFAYKQQMLELLELRLGVEPVAARFAAERISDENAAILLDSAAKMLTAMNSDDKYAFYDADADFHRTLLEASGNIVIAQLSNTITAVLRTRIIETPPRLSLASVNRHIKLAKAIMSHDSKSAKNVSEKIIIDTISELKEAAHTNITIPNKI